ncbi:patatin-like phospholipase family protein [Roseococcus sp. DSY-14]|uniref:patatin-like phospholipase family protein n=1 Tax=Roseococcus sp. DSY-14 TaxID=3369650 RepID=UPI00387A8B24
MDLALQGGGAHGAFTWGVLDRFLEEEWLTLDAISGTSAGAMNGAVLAGALATGGRTQAREALEGFWRKVSVAAAFSPFQRTPLDVAMGRWSLDHSPTFLAMDLMARVFSPYELAPFAANPLEAILAECVDFAALADSPVRLYVTATNVRTGRPRIFRAGAVTPQALLASACLPTMFQAVEIEGEAYWDGGYSGNPTMTPLISAHEASDTIIVPINPIERPGTPTSARDILNRLNEVSFNAVLLKELRMIALLRGVAAQLPPGALKGEAGAWARMRIHSVRNGVMAGLGYSSKLNAEWAFLTMLRDKGREAAAEFLAEHADALGKRSTLPIERLALDEDGLGEDEVAARLQAMAAPAPTAAPPRSARKGRAPAA